MSIKTVYLYDPISMAPIGAYHPQESPEEPGKFITPISHVDVEIPPFDPAKQTCRLADTKDAWHVKTISVSRLSARAPVVKRDLAEVKNDHVAALVAACQAAIPGGFVSFALESPHLYPAKDKDQQNLAAAVLESMLPNLAEDWRSPLWCADSEGKWDFIDHTAAQIQAVSKDANATRIAAMRHLKTLVEQITTVEVNAATTEEAAKAAVLAVTWSAPTNPAIKLND